MLARMLPQVDRGDRFLEERVHGSDDGVRFTGEAEDRAIVRGVRLDIQQTNTGRPDAIGAPVEHGGPPPFADIRNTLDQRHGLEYSQSPAGPKRPKRSPR